MPAYLKMIPEKLYGTARTLYPHLLAEAFSEAEHSAVPCSRTTIWMDGFRGIAAVTVVCFHFAFAYTGVAWYGYGVDGQYSLFSLPIIRVLFEGTTSVVVFFTIAGYVNSNSFIQLVKRDEQEAALRRLSKSAFRRWFRLYIPTYLVLFLMHLLAYMHCFDLELPMLEEPDVWKYGGYWDLSRFHLPLWVQACTFANDVAGISRTWADIETYPPVGAGHLWTIPLEYNASIVLYFALVVTAYCRPIARLFVILVFASTCIYYRKLAPMCYLMGAAIAQYCSIRTNEPPAWPTDTVKSLKNYENLDCDGLDHITHPSVDALAYTKRIFGEFVHRVLRPLGYVNGLWLMSTPYRNANSGKQAYGFIWIHEWLAPPSPWRDLWPRAYGTFIFVFLLATSKHQMSSSNISVFHRVFCSRVARYLGKVMFGLYLVHIPIMEAIGYPTPYYIWKIIGNDSTLKWCLGFWPGLFLTLSVTIVVADFWTREIEPRCINVGSWVEKLFCI